MGGYDVAVALFSIVDELATICEHLPDSAGAQREALLEKAEQLIDLGQTLRSHQGTTASVLVNLASAG